MKVRNVTGQVVVVPVDGGIAVAVDGVVEVADEDGRALVAAGQFAAVRATTTRKRAPSKPRKS